MSNQNICQHAVIITSVFKEESSVSAWTSSTEVVNTGLPKLPLNDLKSLRHRLAEMHVIQVIAWNISVAMQFSVAIFDTYACSYYTFTAMKRCSVNPFH